MREDAVKIFCLSHKSSLAMPRSKGVVACGDGPATHILGENFPHSGRWLYCCDCQHYWAIANGHNDYFRQCPSCGSSEHPRYYSCDQCGTTMVDFWGTNNRKEFHIMPWGQPSPFCPACTERPKSVPQTHTCAQLHAMLTTARPQCPFCQPEEASDASNGPIVMVSISELKEASDLAVAEIAKKLAEVRSSAADAGLLASLEPAISPPAPEEFSGTAALMENEPSGVDLQAGETEAEVETRLHAMEERAREAEEPRRRKLDGAWEAVDARIARASAEAKSKAESVLSQVAEQASKDFVTIASRLETEVAARQEAERLTAEARASVEAARQEVTEFEARFQELEARVREVEEQRRLAEASFVQEAAQRVLAERKAAEAEQARVEAETGLREAQEKVSHAEAAAEIRASVARTKAQQVEEKHRTELGKTKAEFEAKIRETEATVIEAINRVRKVEAAAVEGEKAYQAELVKLGAMVEASEVKAKNSFDTREEAEKRCLETEARLRATEIKIQEAESGLRESVANAKQIEESFKTEIATIREANARKAETIAKQAEERHRAEIAGVRAEAETMAQEAKARVQQLEEQVRQAGDRHRKRIEDSIARVQEALLALEEAQKKAAAAEESHQRTLNEIEVIRKEAADRIEAEVKARQDAEQAATDAIARLHVQTESARLVLETEMHEIARRTDEQYRSKLAEADKKVSSLEAGISEAEIRAHRIEEEGKIKAARVAAETDARLKALTHACEDAEKKYADAQARAIEAESRARALALAGKEAERKLAELKIKPSEKQAAASSQPQPHTFAMPLQCPLCSSALSENEDRCSGCKAILTLTDIDAVIGNLEVDRSLLLDAIEKYRGMAKNSRDFGVHFHLGIAYLNLNQLSEAVRHLQLVCNLCPENQSLKSQLENLKQRQNTAMVADKNERNAFAGGTESSRQKLPDAAVVTR